MKKSNEYIAESVFETNLKFLQKQNETKKVFFKCLNENKPYEEFRYKLEKIWGTLDHEFLQDQLVEYQDLIHEQTMIGHVKTEIEPEGDSSFLFTLVPLSVILTQEARLIKSKLRDYNGSLRSYAYKLNKQEYLKLKVQRYNDNIVEYVSHEGGKSKYVALNTYASMIQNTNLTRSAWNTTLNDGDIIGATKYYIPYHPFSCPECIRHQNKLMSKQEVIRLVGFAEEGEGDILHPNCKCTLTILEPGEKMEKSSGLSKSEKADIYDIRQKVNTLTLQKERIKTDTDIQKMLGNYDEVDKLNQQRNKINATIRALKEALPTEALQKQVVAIKR